MDNIIKHITNHLFGGEQLGIVALGFVLVFVSALDVYGKDVTPIRNDVSTQESKSEEFFATVLNEDETDSNDSDLFGIGGGYFHPYIIFGMEYTDNLFNVFQDPRIDEADLNAVNQTLAQSDLDEDVRNLGHVSNILTRVSPGIRISMPRSNYAPVVINTNNTSPGGLRYQVRDIENTEKLLVHGRLQLDYKKYSADSRLDDTDVIGEGLLRYNMSGGLSLQVLDRYIYGQDQLEIGAIFRNDLRRFQSNLFTATADYEVTEKLNIKGEYSNFSLLYDNEINELFNRTDDVISIYGIYNYSLKTSFFLNWRFMDIVFSTAEEKNNKQNYFFGGIRWDTTEKLAMKAQIGSQTRDYESDEVEGLFDSSYLALEFESMYRWTEKTDFTLRLHKRNEESNSAFAINMNVFGTTLGYNQKITDKFTGRIIFLYENFLYNQIDDSDRDDNRYFFRPSLIYQFHDWGNIELAYQHDRRDSSDNLFDYTSNTFILNLKFSL